MTTNTLVKLLNEAGYTNTNTNRERAVRNMNMLLDAGIMTIKFSHSDRYNNKDANFGFWYTAKDGKRRCTAYTVTLYGKTFYGHFMPKRRTINYGQGVVVADDVTYINFPIDEIQTRVAQLISIVREQNDFFAPKLFAAKGDCSCGKCHGRGVIPAFSYYANGICFDCGGSGINRNTLKTHIANLINSATN